MTDALWVLRAASSAVEIASAAQNCCRLIGIAKGESKLQPLRGCGRMVGQRSKSIHLGEEPGYQAADTDRYRKHEFH